MLQEVLAHEWSGVPGHGKEGRLVIPSRKSSLERAQGYLIATHIDEEAVELCQDQ